MKKENPKIYFKNNKDGGTEFFTKPTLKPKPENKLKEWEKEFDKRWKDVTYTPQSKYEAFAQISEDIKSFIRQLLFQQEAEAIEEYANKVIPVLDGRWLGRIEKAVKGERAKILAKLPKEKVETDFLDWHSNEIITTEDRKEARIYRDIFNQCLSDIKALIEKS